jgi:hypothetical protein
MGYASRRFPRQFFDARAPNEKEFLFMPLKIGGFNPASSVIPADGPAPQPTAAQSPATSPEAAGAVQAKADENAHAAAARKRALENASQAGQPSAAPPETAAPASPFARDLERIAQRNLPNNKVLRIDVPAPAGDPTTLTMNDYNRAFAREMLRQNGMPSATDADAEAFLARHRAATGRNFEIAAASTEAVRRTQRDGKFVIEVGVRDHAMAAAGAEDVRRRRAETADAIAAIRQKVSDNSELEQFVLGVGLGVKSGMVGTYQAVRHPIDTAEAVGTMVAHPADTYSLSYIK